AKVKELSALSGNSSGILADTYGNQAIFGGLLSIILIIFLAAPIMKRGWRFAASFTPVIALIATFVFFSFLYFQDSLSSLTAPLGMSPLALAVSFGTVNVVFIKATKYILFDPTKEQAYVPLDEESKVRGKAAVDGAGSRLGKSLGALIIATLSSAFEMSIDDSKLIIFLLILVMLVLWLRAVKKLSIAYKERTEELEAAQAASA
ncbi:MAG: Npt1/Npt2 family nucleotide transporter, partial [Bacteroidota bacterium]